MSELLDELVGQIELHSPEGIRDCFARGIDPNDAFKDKPLIYELTSEYTRSARFRECVRAFVVFKNVLPPPARILYP